MPIEAKMALSTVALAASRSPQLNQSLQSFTLFSKAFGLNFRNIICNYRFPPINSIRLSNLKLHNSREVVFSAKPLNWKRDSDIYRRSSYSLPVKAQRTDGKLALAVLEAVSEDELLAAANLRVRTFYEFNQSYGVEEYRRYMSEMEFEALKDRIAGKRLGFKRVVCVIATIPNSKALNLTYDLSSLCKVIVNGEERVVVGSLDLNQSIRLPDEIAGTRPKGIAADFGRAYLTNVCVAKELHRKGIGTALVVQGLKIAKKWGITDLYVHVAVENESARNLYEKSGFIYESDEPAWQARFLGRSRRVLLWADLSKHISL